MTNASKPDLEPPAHIKLRDGYQVFWVGVVRARDEWTKTDLVVAGQLARCLHDTGVGREVCQTEGSAR